MTKAFFGKVMWVGRATTFCVGLAVVLAVVLGVGTAALAAVPGDPFKLGRVNAVGRLTTLVGNVDGAMLRVDNDGFGTALDLRVGASSAAPNQKIVAPMTVDSRAKVANLNADQVDGMEANEFMRGFTRRVRAVSGSDSSATKTVVARCPEGERVVGGTADIERPTINTPEPPPAEFPVALQSVGDEGGFIVFSDRTWSANAVEMLPYDGVWHLRVSVVCATAEPDLVPAGE